MRLGEASSNTYRQGFLLESTFLANVLDLLGRVVTGAQVRLERAAEELDQDLEADLGVSRVVAALAELVADEGVLGPSELVEVEHRARRAQLLPNQVPTLVRHVRVLDSEDHRHLGLDLSQSVDRVVAAHRALHRRVPRCVRSERPAVDVRSEVRHACRDAGVELEKRSFL